MLPSEAIQLIEWIPRDKVKPADAWPLTNIESLARSGMRITDRESKLLQEIYRYTQCGDREVQQFKAYQRPRSRGI